MHLCRVSVGAGLALLLLQGVALPQSLADLARRTEEDRAKAKTQSKTQSKTQAPPPQPKSYTNDDLQRTPTPPASAAAGTKPAASTQAEAAKPDAKDASEEPPKDEKYWKDRITAARAQLARSKLLFDVMQSKVNALSAYAITRDDPGQQAVVTGELQTASRELERLQKDIQNHTKAVADIQEEARRAGVPPGWLR
jgi:hypothetical protein